MTKLKIPKKYQDKRKLEKKKRDEKHGDLYKTVKPVIKKKDDEVLIGFHCTESEKKTNYFVREKSLDKPRWKARFGTEEFLKLYIEIYKIKPFICLSFEVNKMNIQDLLKIKNDYITEQIR